MQSSKELSESDVQHPKALLGKGFFLLRPTAGGRWQKKRGFHLFFRQHSGIWLLLWCRWQGNETLRWHINTNTLCFPSFHSFILSYFSICLCNNTLSGLFLKLCHVTDYFQQALRNTFCFLPFSHYLQFLLMYRIPLIIFSMMYLIYQQQFFFPLLTLSSFQSVFPLFHVFS